MFRINLKLLFLRWHIVSPILTLDILRGQCAVRVCLHYILILGETDCFKRVGSGHGVRVERFLFKVIFLRVPDYQEAPEEAKHEAKVSINIS